MLNPRNPGIPRMAAKYANEFFLSSASGKEGAPHWLSCLVYHVLTGCRVSMPHMDRGFS